MFRHRIFAVDACRLALGKSRINFQQQRYLRKKNTRNLPTPKFEKRLDVVILGAPNVGKSVLLNSLVNEKLAATNKKKHTTRMEILGVYNHSNTQLAFYDTPGFVAHQEATGVDTNALRDIGTEAAAKADVILLVVDASHASGVRHAHFFCEMVRTALDYAKIEVILILNKVDLVFPKTDLLETTRELVSLINGVKLGPENAHRAQLDTTTFMISAKMDDGVIDIKNYLMSIAVEKEWIIPKDSDSRTSLTTEERVEQIVLEKMLEHTHDEIPYVAKIECTSISRLSATRLRIDVDIGVQSGSQQRIVVGQQGRTLVKVRQAAVSDLEKILGKEVILYLWAKVRSKSKLEQI